MVGLLATEAFRAWGLPSTALRVNFGRVAPLSSGTTSVAEAAIFPTVLGRDAGAVAWPMAGMATDAKNNTAKDFEIITVPIVQRLHKSAVSDTERRRRHLKQALLSCDRIGYRFYQSNRCCRPTRLLGCGCTSEGMRLRCPQLRTEICSHGEAQAPRLRHPRSRRSPKALAQAYRPLSDHGPSLRYEYNCCKRMVAEQEDVGIVDVARGARQ